MPGQRWYAGKGRQPVLRAVGDWTVPGCEVPVHVHLLLDEAASPPTLYQVPVTERPEPLASAGPAFIGELDQGGRSVYLYDGPHDPAFARALLHLLMRGQEAGGHGMEVRGVSLLGDTGVVIRSSKVHSGEQSNTSIVYEVARSDAPADREPARVVCKLFRAVHHGENPDVILQSALAEAGSTHVPRSIGSIVGEWDDPGRPDGRAEGHLAFAQEFLSNMEDGWELALRLAAAGEDFSGAAFALGGATAEIHATLARVMPSRPPTAGDIAETIASWRRRLATAVAEVPALAGQRDIIEDVYERAATLTWPRLQRIHGDYHLGQVLVGRDGRWVALDFEGEPLRPMDERSEPDFATRDIAGMLRSFDYVAGSQGNTDAATGWALAARGAFLDGYADTSTTDVRGYRELLDAFELDKALYEAVYEARNRPAWLPIPVGAVERLVARARAGER